MIKKNKHKKTIFISLLFVILVLPLFSIISAEDLVCCEKTNTGDFCQYVPTNECVSSNADPTSCDSTTYCQKGTCVDDNRGVCTAGVRKSTCENSQSGYWNPTDIDELSSCQQGCCFVGENTEFVTQIECTQIATDSGINTKFDSSIKEEFTCLDFSSSSAKGACVLDSSGIRDCDMTSKSDCQSRGGSFNEGYLCSADFLGGICGKTKNTECGDNDKVYFLDTCGNYANVYDANKFSTVDSEWTPVMEDYWTRIQDPSCSVEEGLDCGNCDRIPPIGTICSKARTSEKPEFGEYICGSLNCEYKGETYKNGERWCADSPGTFDGPILVDDATRANVINENIITRLAGGAEKYNLPGSRYTVLTCWDGEIIPEPCSDYRSEFCAQSTIDTIMTSNFRTAWCEENKWRGCGESISKADCEDEENNCKWLEGYTFIFDEEGNPANFRTDTEMKSNIQGSCVPLIAPGFDFWNPESDAQLICSLGAVGVQVTYEEWWGRRNANEVERFEKENYAENHCFENCYAIPGYGDDLGAAKIKLIHEGTNPVVDAISQRKGYYCINNKGEAVLGSVRGKISCASDTSDQGWLDFRVRANYPIFFTNNDWIEFLKERTKSLGDCGYKENLNGEYSDPNSEIIVGLFQKIKGKDETAKNITEQKIIFRGDSYLEEEEIFESARL